MRVLGIDPGLTRCGVGVVDPAPGRRVTLVEVGVVRSAPGAEPAERLRVVGDEVERWLDRHRPDVVAVERVFAQHNLRTVMGTAQVSGVVMVAAARRGIVVSTVGTDTTARDAQAVLQAYRLAAQGAAVR